jgi:acetolactate decarboxylase
MKHFKKTLFLVGISLVRVSAQAQQTDYRDNVLFQYGIGEAFLGGLFRGTLSVGDLKKHGDFGIAAPDLVDGEVIMNNGKIYQTKASGITTEMPDSAKLPMALACFFKPDTSFTITNASSEADAFAQIDAHLHNKNSIYAVKITGLMSELKTKAFYPVSSEPFPAVASLIANQKIFNMSEVKGILFGVKVPNYWTGINIAGYHLHYLGENYKTGGHVLDFTPENVLVEIALIRQVNIQVPQDSDFIDYSFKTRTP